MQAEMDVTTDLADVDDISSFCRVCLQEPSLDEVLDLLLIYDEDSSFTYNDCFAACTNTDLLRELRDMPHLPHNLCKSCGLELQVAYDFQKKVAIASRFLEQVHTRTSRDSSRSMCKSREQQEKQRQFFIDDEDVEEYLDYEEETYQLIDEDASAVQSPNGDEAIMAESATECAVGHEDDDDIETVSVLYYDEKPSESDEEQRQQQPAEDSAQMFWQAAVVTVANESHLPLNEADEQHAALALPSPSECSVQEVAASQRPLSLTTGVTATTTRKRYSGQFACPHCQKLFPNHSRMQQHSISHEPASCRPRHACPHCSRTYATKQAMSIHVNTIHTRTAAHCCSVCSKIYASRKTLEVHMRYHVGSFPYACDQCERKFAQLSHLKTHTNVKHNSERFCCAHAGCGKFFVSSTSLRNHEFTHGRSMPFICEYCQRGHPSRAKLRSHVRRQHNRELTLEQLESMRQFHVARTKLKLVKVAAAVNERED